MNSFGEYFTYRGSELVCEGVALRTVAAEFGSPLYVYTERGFVERFQEIDRAFSGMEHLICYSIKSNPNINLLKIMTAHGSGMDVVSGGEIYRALAAGADPRKIVFAGVGKTDEEIGYALDTGILMFNCESMLEIGEINRIALGKNMIADIAIRINPDVDANTHQYITTGKKENKFGIAIEHLKENLDALKGFTGVRLRGIHAHIGSQIARVEPFIDALDRQIVLIGELRGLGFDSIENINLGGGFGIRYKDEESFPVERLAGEIGKRIAPLGLRLIVEPGRYLSGNNGVLIVKVLYKKKSGGKTFLITDGAMNDLIRPSLYNAYQHILNCVLREGTEKADVVGPVCESGDFFAKDREVSLTGQGDYLAVMSAGAYGMSMASRYNSRRLPAEALIMPDGRARLIRARDLYEDLIAQERV
ncbi:MAG: diaminopimelate decarboxylase [Spirochaetes bacterium]|nr:MAG: diaminopimelate decarboxylase [Spirochaetota bacterium]